MKSWRATHILSIYDDKNRLVDVKVLMLHRFFLYTLEEWRDPARPEYMLSIHGELLRRDSLCDCTRIKLWKVSLTEVILKRYDKDVTLASGTSWRIP